MCQLAVLDPGSFHYDTSSCVRQDSVRFCRLSLLHQDQSQLKKMLRLFWPILFLLHYHLRHCGDINRSVRATEMPRCASHPLAGIWLVVRLPDSAPNSCASVVGGCAKSMRDGFLIGRLLGYVTW
jgi:hypothetical protein